MSILLLNPTRWSDYGLIDSGNGKKLERFGPYVFSRPEPQALWSKRLPNKTWEKASGPKRKWKPADNMFGY